MNRSFLLLALFVSAGPLPSRAQSLAHEAIVVYNSRLPESKAVADHYVQRRGVPPNHVFGFDLPTAEDISRADFQDLLQRPLAKALEAKRLWHFAPETVPATNSLPARTALKLVSSKIRYAVLCFGIPLRIAEDPNLKEEGTEKMRPELRRNGAAVDSELAVLPLLEEKIPLAGPLRSPVYLATNSAALHPTNGVLLVARLDGPTAAIARALVDKALQAETNGLWGRAYFDLRNTSDPGLKLGDEWLRNASELCRHLGFETVVDENPGTFPIGFPLSQIAIYAGWYDENACGPFALPTVEFMPGAFAYHLHSFSACTLRSTTQYWVGPLLAKGATITMGCVAEPYLVGTPDIAAFIARLIYSGFTFGESAYASQLLLSWQTTVVGDPLYRPFGRNPDQLQQELERNNSPWREWCYLRLLNMNFANGKPLPDCIAFLEQLELTKHSAVLQEKLADLYAAQGKPASAAHAYAEALTLAPSPQQRIRLHLELGNRLGALGREAEAFDAYDQLLQETPTYPDKTDIYRRLLPLAQKLQKTNDVERLETALRQPTEANDGKAVRKPTP